MCNKCNFTVDLIPIFCYSLGMANIKDKLQQAAVRVADLKRQLNLAQDEFDVLYEQVEGGKINQEHAGVNAEDLTETSIEQVASLLKSNPEKEWGYDELSKELPNIPRTSIRVFLYKLRAENRVLKVARGKWRSKVQVTIKIPERRVVK
jgi:hypothetical protein